MKAALVAIAALFVAFLAYGTGSSGADNVRTRQAVIEAATQ